jgi:hypothetical protein
VATASEGLATHPALLHLWGRDESIQINQAEPLGLQCLLPPSFQKRKEDVPGEQAARKRPTPMSGLAVMASNLDFVTYRIGRTSTRSRNMETGSGRVWRCVRLTNWFTAIRSKSLNAMEWLD